MIFWYLYDDSWDFWAPMKTDDYLDTKNWRNERVEVKRCVNMKITWVEIGKKSWMKIKIF
jgi:hypothetical protein